jgi:hypothetical protein
MAHRNGRLSYMPSSSAFYTYASACLTAPKKTADEWVPDLKGLPEDWISAVETTTD